MAYKCKNCGKFVAKDAAVCKHCGQENPAELTENDLLKRAGRLSSVRTS